MLADVLAAIDGTDMHCRSIASRTMIKPLRDHANANQA
jgi:hypothetical protein